MIKEKLEEAMSIKDNDVNSFVWKFAKNKSTNVQEEIALVDATDEQLQTFYNHCMSMLYSEDKVNPGRYVLLEMLKQQRNKCNVELFLRDLETGKLTPDGTPYPRYLYCQDIRTYMDNNPDYFKGADLKALSIASVTMNLPREYTRISINDAIDACLDKLGYLDPRHITFKFILKMGVYLTQAELKDLTDDKGKKKPELIKEKLGLKSSIRININPTGLSFAEFRAMINLKPKKYSALTTDQLTTLRNKVLFRLENEVQLHIEQWEKRISQIKKVAEMRGLELRSEYAKE